MKKLVIICAACGVGKTTVKDYLNGHNLVPEFIGIDTDEVGINWWDYEGTENESKFPDACIAKAVEMSGKNNVIFSTCMNPFDYYEKVSIPMGISATFFIALTCSDEELTSRLKARPEERMCGSEEFIASQIDYNNWFRKNKGKFQFSVDNTKLSIEETANTIAKFVNVLEIAQR